MNQETIDAFYLATIYEVLLGVKLKELSQVILDFEEEELYEECAGIKKALDFVKVKTIEEIEIEYDELLRLRQEEE